MRTIAEVLSFVDHTAPLQERINQIARALVAEYQTGNRLLEHTTYYVFNVYGIPSYGAMTFGDDIETRTNDMKKYCVWCAAHGVAETIHVGEVWQTLTDERPSRAADRTESLFIAGLGQKEGGAVSIGLPVNVVGAIDRVVMRPRGEFGPFELISPSVELTPDIKQMARETLNANNDRVFANFLVGSKDDGTFVIDPFGQHFGIWYPIYRDRVPPVTRLDH